MTLSINAKKTLSVIGASLAGGIATALVKDEPQLVALFPVWAQVFAGMAITALAHWIPTWGHQEKLEQVATEAVAKANAQ